MSNLALATAFTCTNTLASTVIVGVEVFGEDGGAARNDASASSLAIAPGATRVFSTGSMAAFSIDSNLALFINRGSARVLVTTTSKASPGLLCTAILADLASNPPSVAFDLPVIRKNTQQGD